MGVETTADSGDVWMYGCGPKCVSAGLGHRLHTSSVFDAQNFVEQLQFEQCGAIWLRYNCWFLQNNMNYSSLTILLRCPQAPVPDLGQNNPQSRVPSSPESTPPVEDMNSPQSRADAAAVGTRLDGSLAHLSTYQPFASAAVQPSSVPASVSASSPRPVMVTSTGSTLASFRGGITSTDDDDFDDFKTAPVPSVPASAPPPNRELTSVQNCTTSSG